MIGQKPHCSRSNPPKYKIVYAMQRAVFVVLLVVFCSVTASMSLVPNFGSTGLLNLQFNSIDIGRIHRDSSEAEHASYRLSVNETGEQKPRWRDIDDDARSETIASRKETTKTKVANQRLVTGHIFAKIPNRSQHPRASLTKPIKTTLAQVRTKKAYKQRKRPFLKSYEDLFYRMLFDIPTDEPSEETNKTLQSTFDLF